MHDWKFNACSVDITNKLLKERFDILGTTPIGFLAKSKTRRSIPLSSLFAKYEGD